MSPLYLYNGKLLVVDGKLAINQNCCCGECSGPCDTSEDCAPGCACMNGACVETKAYTITAVDECSGGYFVNGPQFIWEWKGFFGKSWQLVGITRDQADKICLDFTTNNNIVTVGASAPPFDGAFVGEQITWGCACES